MFSLLFFYFLLLGDAGTIAFMTRNHPSVFRIRVVNLQKEVILSISASTTNDSWNDRSSNSDNKKTSEKNQDKLSFPWTDFQDWALRDNIAKYIVSVPHSDSTEPQLYGLWRTLSNEVVELSGYPVEILQQRYKEQQQGQGQSLSLSPAILPLLDEYEFETSGGLSGRVYGIPGVADGSKIETTALRDIQTTLPKGYILTDDQETIYELGSPIKVSYSLDGVNQQFLSEKNKITVAQQVAVVASNAGKTTAELTGDDMLIRLGATTGILLAGATAFNMLSHHLTVNIFWT